MTLWTVAHSAALNRSPVVSLNFHDIGPSRRRTVADSLARLSRLGPTLDLDEPEADGVRILVAFYDGYREASLFGAELCHRLGVRALFFPVFTPGSDEPGAGTLTDDDLADIASAHEVGFHTSSHLMASEITTDNLRREVTEPLQRIEATTGRPARVAAWCWGGRFDAATMGDRAVRDAGIRFLVSNWSVESIPAS